MLFEDDESRHSKNSVGTIKKSLIYKDVLKLTLQLIEYYMFIMIVRIIYKGRGGGNKGICLQ
jgi:hypothetical protein